MYINVAGMGSNIYICKKYMMEDLIKRLVTETGITPEQAQKTIETLAAYVKEKYPMLGGAVNNIFKKK